MSKLILDAMGGDHGPPAVLQGAQDALEKLNQNSGELLIVGDREILEPLLKKRRFKKLREQIENNRESGFKVALHHAPESIEMDDSIRAIRQKRNASINIGCEIAAQSYKSGGEPAAFISTGHSGAVMTSAVLHMGRLPGVERPAIAVKLPTLSGDGCVMIDVGANVDCKPEHLRDFAIMGAIYAQVERKKSSLPKVAVLSNGEERKKGNELTRASIELIDQLPCFKAGADPIGEFTGYAEGKEIFNGLVDVVVTDGFVGNVVLKSLEGLGSAVVKTLKREAKSNPLTILGFLLSAGVFARFKKKFDYAEYGAAPLLGVAGYCFICHGRSNARAIQNALFRAQSAVAGKTIEKLEKVLKSIGGL